MAAEPIILNPIGWGQFRLLGGLKRTLGIAGAYAGAAFIILLLLYRACGPMFCCRASPAGRFSFSS